MVLKKLFDGCLLFSRESSLLTVPTTSLLPTAGTSSSGHPFPVNFTQAIIGRSRKFLKKSKNGTFFPTYRTGSRTKKQAFALFPVKIPLLSRGVVVSECNFG
ncbi:MAG: hypothetical protein ACYC9O_16565 [Candidatus Latescibacterota bacterium]